MISIVSIRRHRLEVAREKTDVQDQQVSAKSATAQGRRRAEQGVQSMVGIHGSRFHPEEVRPGETSNIYQDLFHCRGEKKRDQCSFEKTVTRT